MTGMLEALKAKKAELSFNNYPSFATRARRAQYSLEDAAMYIKFVADGEPITGSADEEAKAIATVGDVESALRSLYDSAERLQREAYLVGVLAGVYIEQNAEAQS